ncbi:MAG: twin-arginine translocase subunit TatC [Granulosicoccaceae bacterium]|jgi:sec-independent protein translocase protein TatC
MTKQTESAEDNSLISHLIELRDRLLRSVLVIIVLLVPLFYFGNELYTLLAEPLLRHMPEGTNMIATEVASPFLTPFKLALIAAIFLAVPYLLYQIWAFMAPGLYQHERKLVVPLLFSSTLLFYAGIAFAYYVVFPLVFGFFIGVAPEGVAVMTDISKYLDFVLKLFIAFGIAFEVPIATILMCWTGMTTPDRLAKKRPYIIVGAFVIGMLMTPPDIISQTLLALPMWMLFEVGIFFARRMPQRDEAESEEEPSIATPGQAAAAAATATGDDKVTPDQPDIKEEAEPYTEMTDEEMEDEFDRLEDEEEGLNAEDDTTKKAPDDEPDSGKD